jgi:hypothetical protein
VHVCQLGRETSTQSRHGWMPTKNEANEAHQARADFSLLLYVHTHGWTGHNVHLARLNAAAFVAHGSLSCHPAGDEYKMRCKLYISQSTYVAASG